MVDLTPLVQALASLALAAVTAATPFVVPLLRKYLGARLTATQAAAIQQAAQAGAGMAYGYLAEPGRSYTIQTRNEAVALGLNHALRSVPDTMAAMGVSSVQVESMVRARLGGLLASDPTVGVAGLSGGLPSGGGGQTTAQQAT